jgi:hypothetical protein
MPTAIDHIIASKTGEYSRQAADSEGLPADQLPPFLPPPIPPPSLDGGTIPLSRM